VGDQDREVRERQEREERDREAGGARDARPTALDVARRPGDDVRGGEARAHHESV
jgi:hypothetical protein